MNFPYWMGETPRANTAWGDLENSHLLESVESGKCISDIAKEHGRTLIAISCRLRDVCPQFKAYIKQRELADRQPFSTSNNQDIIKDLRFIFEKWDNKGKLIVPVEVHVPAVVTPPTLSATVEDKVQEPKDFPLSYLAIGLSIVAIIMSAIAVHGS